MSRQLRAFKRAPTVELQIEDIAVGVKRDRILVSLGEDGAWLSWEEWRDLVRRIDHSMQWIAANTPEDVTGKSFDVPPSLERESR